MITFRASCIAALCCLSLNAQIDDLRNPEVSAPYAPINIRTKFVFAARDSTDPSTFLFAGVTAGFSQLDNSHPSFGQGMEGFSHRYARAFLNQASGNFLIGAALPAALHQDPRYFRKGRGSVIGRALWAATRVTVARNDQGAWGFNTSEFLGAGMAASIANAYYPDRVGFSPTMQRLGSRIGTDILTNLLKEFLPDVKKKLARRNQSSGAPVK